MVTEVEAEAPVSRETYAELLKDGETPEEALQRLEKKANYTKVIGTDAGQALLAAASAQVESTPNGGVKRKGKTIAAATEVAPEIEALAAKVAAAAPAAPAEALASLIIPIAQIETTSNVRDDLGDLEELAASIREHGIREPITVTQVDNRQFPELAAFRVLTGHRRLAAAALAGLTAVPALVDPNAELGTDSARRSVLQLVENVQRADLNAIAVAHALQAILEARKDLTHGDVAKWLGKDRSWVSNALRLLETAPEVQAKVAAGEISATHARAIAAVDVDLQGDLLKRVVDQGMSAKDAERQAQYVKDDAKRIRERNAEIERRAIESIAVLEKVANKAKARIAVESYSGIGENVRAALEAAGWTATGRGYGSVDVIAQAGECGCTAWVVSLPYEAKSKVEVKPACDSPDHRAARKAEVDARWKRDQAKAQEDRRLEREKIEAASARAKDTIGEILAERPLTALARRLVTWGLMVADEEPDEVLVAKYLGGEVEGQEHIIYEADDAAWLLIEAIPDADLEDVQARLVSRLFGSYMAGDGVKAAVEAWQQEARPQTLELVDGASEGQKVGKLIAAGVTTGALECVGSNHVPGHTAGCSRFVAPVAGAK